jgi:hypothetical protein
MRSLRDKYPRAPIDSIRLYVFYSSIQSNIRIIQFDSQFDRIISHKAHELYRKGALIQI